VKVEQSLGLSKTIFISYDVRVVYQKHDEWQKWDGTAYHGPTHLN